MADGFWNRQPPAYSSSGMSKRSRPDYDFPPGQELVNYYTRDEERGGSRLVKDTKAIGSAYDRYLQSSQLPSFGSGEASSYSGGGARLERGGGPGLHGEPSLMGGHGAVGSDLAQNGRGMGYANQLTVDPVGRSGGDVLPLPRNASNTIYVEGLPSDSTRREVAHIFRPFLGYKEVRLVSKESKHRGGEPLILCFVDFVNAACAATALSALQDYKMDEHDSDSHILRMQFARFAGPRSGSGSGSRGKR